MPITLCNQHATLSIWATLHTYSVKIAPMLQKSRTLHVSKLTALKQEAVHLECFHVRVLMTNLDDGAWTDQPKSAIFSSPKRPRSRFSGLMSRWMTFLEWQYMSASDNWNMYCNTDRQTLCRTARVHAMLHIANLTLLVHHNTITTTTTTVLRPFVRDYPVEPVPEETLTHPPSWSSSNLHQLLPSTTIHSILLVQIMCLAIFLHNLFPCPHNTITCSSL